MKHFWFGAGLLAALLAVSLLLGSTVIMTIAILRQDLSVPKYMEAK